MQFEKGHFNILRKVSKEYPLENRKEPELYREIFPYSTIPKTIFDDHIVTFDVPEQVFITDTTFRDGQQAREPFTVRQIVDIFKLLSKLSGEKGIIRTSEFFMYSDKDKKALEKVLELDLQYPQPTGWIRAQRKDFELLKQFELKETGILTSVSDYHIYMKLKMDRKQAFDFYVDIVAYSLERGIVPRCHFEDITRADLYGFTIPLAQKFMQMSKEAGMPVKIRLCDTMGFGVPYPGATAPRSIAKLVHAFRNDAGVPSEWLEWHGHNDFHKVLVNTVTAWLHGVSGANCALFGLGERTGNCPTEAMILEYMSLFSVQDINTLVITELKEYFEKEIKYVFPTNYPFIGRDFNVTKAGIHVDGLVKNEEIYNVFDTVSILNRTPSISITDKTGTAGVIHWLYKNYPKAKSLGLTKKHPKVIKVYDWILSEYDKGRITSISDQEMEKAVRTFIPELVKTTYIELRQRISGQAYKIIQEASVKPEIVSMNPDLFEPLLIEVADNDPAMKLISVTNKGGKKIGRNITQLIDRKAYQEKMLDEDFSDREWFREPMKSGSTHITDIYVSKITGKLTITVSTPIFDEGDHIKGILAIDFNFDELANEI
jgi:citrate (Re)-synthase